MIQKKFPKVPYKLSRATLNAAPRVCVPAVQSVVKAGEDCEVLMLFRLRIPPSTDQKWFVRVGEQCADMMELLARKNADYGHENVTDFDWWGVVVRLNDKFRRIRNLTLKFLKGQQEAVKDESFDDTILDLANYAVILRMVRGGKW